MTRQAAEDAGDPESAVRIALLDLGNKENITRCLTERGAFVRQFPMSTGLGGDAGMETHRLDDFEWSWRPLCDARRPSL